MEKDQLKCDLEEMIVLIRNKDVESILLNARLLKTQCKGPSTAEKYDLRMKNNILQAQNAALQE